MSVRVNTAVWGSFKGGGSELLTMLALADWSDDDGLSWPSMATLAAKVRLSRSQTQRVVHKLIDQGYVAVEGNEHGGRPGATRRYRIALEQLRAEGGETSRAHATGRSEDKDGSRGCAATGRANATQHVNEPSTNHQYTPNCGAAAQRKRAGSNKAKTSIAADFALSDRVRHWAAERGYGDLDAHFEHFQLKCQANDYRYSDWDAALMKAISEDWARRRGGQAEATRTRLAPKAESFAEKTYGQGGLL